MLGAQSFLLSDIPEMEVTVVSIKWPWGDWIVPQQAGCLSFNSYKHHGIQKTAHQYCVELLKCSYKNKRQRHQTRGRVITGRFTFTKQIWFPNHPRKDSNEVLFISDVGGVEWLDRITSTSSQKKDSLYLRALSKFRQQNLLDEGKGKIWFWLRKNNTISKKRNTKIPLLLYSNYLLGTK